MLEHGDFARTRDEILFGIVCECKLNSHVCSTLLAVKSLRYGPFPDISRLLYLNQEVGPSAPPDKLSLTKLTELRKPVNEIQQVQWAEVYTLLRKG